MGLIGGPVWGNGNLSDRGNPSPQRIMNHHLPLRCSSNLIAMSMQLLPHFEFTANRETDNCIKYAFSSIGRMILNISHWNLSGSSHAIYNGRGGWCTGTVSSSRAVCRGETADDGTTDGTSPRSTNPEKGSLVVSASRGANSRQGQRRREFGRQRNRPKACS